MGLSPKVNRASLVKFDMVSDPPNTSETLTPIPTDVESPGADGPIKGTIGKDFDGLCIMW